jgi:hypothetical protein
MKVKSHCDLMRQSLNSNQVFDSHAHGSCLFSHSGCRCMCILNLCVILQSRSHPTLVFNARGVLAHCNLNCSLLQVKIFKFLLAACLLRSNHVTQDLLLTSTALDMCATAIALLEVFICGKQGENSVV